MRIFNSVDKTKYIVAFVLLPAFAVFILVHMSGTFVKPVKPEFQVKSGVCFDYKNIGANPISPARTEIFGRHSGVKGLKQRCSAVRQAKILPVSKFVPEKYINNVYATVRVPYYTEVCKLLTQLIVIYIFMVDGKKRSLKLLCYIYDCFWRKHRFV